MSGIFSKNVQELGSQVPNFLLVWLLPSYPVKLPRDQLPGLPCHELLKIALVLLNIILNISIVDKESFKKESCIWGILGENQ